MKTSNKLLLALIILLIAGMFLSNYQLKNKFDKIDTSDPYWKYPERVAGQFRHVVIKDGNILKINVFQGNKNRLMRSKNMKDWLTATIKNDTLFVEFDKRITLKSNDEENSFLDHTVWIEANELKSITGFDADITIKENDFFDLSVNIFGKTNFNYFIYPKNKHLFLKAHDNAIAFIQSSNSDSLSRAITLHKLWASASENANLFFENVVADTTKIFLKDNASIKARTSILKGLKVE